MDMELDLNFSQQWLMVFREIFYEFLVKLFFDASK